MEHGTLRVVEETLERRRASRMPQPAKRLVLQEILRSNIARGDRVLEIGAGSGAVSRIEPDLTKKYMLSDISWQDLKSGGGSFNDRQVMVADAYSLPFSNGSLDAIVGKCALSVLTKQEEAAREIYRVLKPGGRVVHFLDRTPAFSPLISNVVETGETFFPYAVETPGGYSIVGIQVVSDEVVEEFLLRKVKTPPEVRAEELMRMYMGEHLRKWMLAPDGSLYHEAASTLSLLVGDMFDTREFDGRVWFGESMTAQLIDQGMIATERTVTRSINVPLPEATLREEDFCNCFYSDVGATYRFEDPEVPDGAARVFSRMKVIEARKPI